MDSSDLTVVVREEEDFLKVVGLMRLLPAGVLPVELQLRQRSGGEIDYSVRFGRFDTQWNSRSESSKRKVVYWHAKEGHDPAWSWGRRVTGTWLEARDWDCSNDA